MIEHILLKERRVLIDTGVDRSLIKIRGNSLYQGGRKFGWVANIDSGFQKLSNESVQQGITLHSSQVQSSDAGAGPTTLSQQCLPPVLSSSLPQSPGLASVSQPQS